METPAATTMPERPPLPQVVPDAGAIEVAAGGEPVLARIADLAQTRDRLAGPPVARPDPDDPDQVEQALDELDAHRRRLARQHGRRAARRFVQICRDSLAGVDRDGSRIPARPTALVVTPLDGLADRDRTPAGCCTPWPAAACGPPPS